MILHMTVGEIVTSYRQAANQKQQIGVLADLNACTKTDIKRILEDAGVDADSTYTGRTWNAGEERRLRQLAAEGRTAGAGTSVRRRRTRRRENEPQPIRPTVPPARAPRTRASVSAWFG